MKSVFLIISHYQDVILNEKGEKYTQKMKILK